MCSASVSARASRGGGRAVTSEDTDAAAALPVQMAVTASQMAARQRDSISFGSETTHTRARAGGSIRHFHRVDDRADRPATGSGGIPGWTDGPTECKSARSASVRPSVSPIHLRALPCQPNNGPSDSWWAGQPSDRARPSQHPSV